MKEAIVYRSPLLRIFGLGVAVVIVALGSRFLLRLRPETSAPSTLQEAAQISESLGLYYRSDSADGALRSRVIVSTTPLTFERAGGIGLRDPKHPCWDGTVAVYDAWRRMHVDCNQPHCTIWGKLLVYGDPDLIQRLNSAAP
jgi:hypothetical protein